jgi:hypothetical protein
VVVKEAAPLLPEARALAAPQLLAEVAAEEAVTAASPGNEQRCV